MRKTAYCNWRVTTRRKASAPLAASSNLLHNAGKFTDRGGFVEVTLARTAAGESAVLTVRDTGIGMCAETLTSIFEASNRGETGIERGQGGLGLGLALVKGSLPYMAARSRR